MINFAKTLPWRGAGATIRFYTSVVHLVNQAGKLLFKEGLQSTEAPAAERWIKFFLRIQGM